MKAISEALALICDTNEKIHILADSLSAWDSEKVEFTDEHLSMVGNVLYEYWQSIELSTQHIKENNK